MAAASFAPMTGLKESPLVPGLAALLFVDLQNYNCQRGGALYKQYAREQLEGPDFQYFWSRIQEATPGWQKLQETARAAGIEVIYTVNQSLTRSGRDRALDHRIAGFCIPPGSWDAQVLDALSPGPDELVLPKTTNSPFNSTSLLHLLRSMDRRYLIICGALTDQCVEHTVRDACDYSFHVTLVPDCCVTYNSGRHDASVAAVRSYCRVRSADELAEEIGLFTAAAAAHAAAAANAAAINGAATPVRAPPPLAANLHHRHHAQQQQQSSHAQQQQLPATQQLQHLISGAATAALHFKSPAAHPHHLQQQHHVATALAPSQPNGGGTNSLSYQHSSHQHHHQQLLMMQQQQKQQQQQQQQRHQSPLPSASTPHLRPSIDASNGIVSPMSPPVLMTGAAVAAASSPSIAAAISDGGGSGGGGPDDTAGGGFTGGAAAGSSGGGSNKRWRKMYFEYAKASWETEEEFLMSNGQSWVEVAVRGDPLTDERGVVYCRLCRHYRRDNLLGKGYRSGKRSALREHMATKDHRELVDLLVTGQIAMPPPCGPLGGVGVGGSVNSVGGVATPLQGGAAGAAAPPPPRVSMSCVPGPSTGDPSQLGPASGSGIAMLPYHGSGGGGGNGGGGGGGGGGGSYRAPVPVIHTPATLSAMAAAAAGAGGNNNFYASTAYHHGQLGVPAGLGVPASLAATSSGDLVSVTDGLLLAAAAATGRGPSDPTGLSPPLFVGQP